MSECPPGVFIRRALAYRAARVTACFKVGPVTWERVKPPGYERTIERCKRCLTLRRQHHVL